MANCCSSEYVFYGKKESVEKLYAFLTDIKAKCDNDGIAIVRHDGVRHICHYPNYYILQEALNIPEKDMVSGRGDIIEIEDLEKDEDPEAYFKVICNDSWAPCPEAWFNIIERRFSSDIKLSYKAEEPGCEVFSIYDPDGKFFPEKYVIDGYLGEDSEWEYFESEDDCRKYAVKKIEGYCKERGIAFKAKLYPTLDKLQKFIHDITDDGDYFFNIHKFECAG